MVFVYAVGVSFVVLSYVTVGGITYPVVTPSQQKIVIIFLSCHPATFVYIVRWVVVVLIFLLLCKLLVCLTSLSSSSEDELDDLGISFNLCQETD